MRAAAGTIAAVDDSTVDDRATHDRALDEALRDGGDAPRPAWKTVTFLLVGLWVAIFLLGAAGELLGIEFLQRLTDFKRIFLR